MKVLLFLLCLFAGSAFGQLTWETTEQTFNSKPQDKEVVAKYKFTNTGQQGHKDPERANFVWLHDGRLDARPTMLRVNQVRLKQNSFFPAGPGGRKKQLR